MSRKFGSSRSTILPLVMMGLIGAAGCHGAPTSPPNTEASSGGERGVLATAEYARPGRFPVACYPVAGAILDVCDTQLVNPHPNPSPTLAPTPLPSVKLPSGAQPRIGAQGEGVLWLDVSDYLSPNGDPRNEWAVINVVASPDMGRWELSVDGYGPILYGTGERLNYTDWSGWVNGAMLPEGKHNLRLRSLSGKGAEVVQSITVDITPPTITEVSVSDIEQLDNSDSVNYTYRFKAVDPKVEASGIDESTLKLQNTNVPFNPLSTSKGDAPEHYKLLAQCKLAETDKLDYQIVARDKAGNESVKTEKLEADYGFAGLDERTANLFSGYGDPNSNLCEVTDPVSRSYQIQGFAALPLLLSPGVVIPATLRWMAPHLQRELIKALLGVTVEALEAEANRNRSQSCHAPISDRVREALIQDPAYNTPFVYTGQRALFASEKAYPGKPLKYYVGYAVVDKNGQVLTQETKQKLSVKLNASIVIFQENAKGVPLAHRIVYSNKQHTMGNMYAAKSPKENCRYFTWNGYDQSGRPCDTGMYSVAIAIDDGSPISVSPKVRRPAGLALIPAPARRITGIRVINNGDGQHAPFPNSTKNDKEGAFVFFGGPGFIGPAGFPAKYINTDGSPYDGKSHEWHHIVEEHQNFPASDLVSTGNLVRLDYYTHREISEFYKKNQARYQIEQNGRPNTDMTLRNWLRERKKGFPEQHALGLKILEEVYKWNPTKQGD